MNNINVTLTIIVIIRPHRIYEMRTITIDDPDVCQSVWHGAGCAKTAELIDVLFGVETARNPRNIVSDGNPHPARQGTRGKEMKCDTAFTNLFSWQLKRLTFLDFSDVLGVLGIFVYFILFCTWKVTVSACISLACLLTAYNCRYLNNLFSCLPRRDEPLHKLGSATPC